MRLHVANHPLIAHKLTVLRDRQTPSATFRQLVDELVTLLAYEATREVAVSETPIETPVAPTVGLTLSEPRPIVVPVLRAGLGMLEGMTRLLPTAEVGFLGMRRDDDTLEIETYANRLPDDLSGRQCFVLDPISRVSSSRRMPRKPTSAVGSMRVMPSSMPRPARRTGTTIGRGSESFRPTVGATGVWMGVSVTATSRVAS